MPLEVHPIAADLIDMEQWVRIHYEAFQGLPVGVCWAHRPSDGTFTDLASKRLRMLDDPETIVFKCVDTELNNKIISVAHWSVFERERTVEEIEGTLQLQPPFQGENRPARSEFLVGLNNNRRESMGTKPVILLEQLSTLPEHHRRGAGSMLMKWGTEQSDKLGIVGRLEASAAGAPLYERFGYETVDEVVFDATKYGADEVDVHKVSSPLLPTFWILINMVLGYDTTASFPSLAIVGPVVQGQ